MSELDLGATANQPAPTTTTAAAQPAPGGLVLDPPQPVQAVPEEQAAGAVPVPDARKAELAQRAAGFANELAAMDTRTPEFAKKVDSIASMGDKELRASAGVSNRMLDRPAAVMKAGKGGGGGDAQTRVAGTLNELRNTVTDLDPNRADLTGAKKVLKWLPGGDKIQRYFQRYESAQTQLNAIIKSLDSGQDDLRKDNAAIETEKQNMWTTMGKLSEYNTLASALDDAVTQKVSELEVAGNSDAATALKSDALFAIRQRRQDIMTQMAVSVQGYMALDLVRKNNLELIKGVDRAQTTTISALRTAVIVSQALARQKLVLDQISALNTTTSNLIESTSQQLRQQGAEINQQAASSTIDVQKLQAAFDNVFQTMDAIDSFRAQSVDSMAQTVTALEGQIERARPYLERTRRGEGNTAELPGDSAAGQLPPAGS
ncbi:toxic anion resistance protein [uncultured Jatrophihabitans sp.]|uniref:toxic anion resistance protein n=1 Tax=uncultured Jatrophihabitans sp. TaxID=1610747 RepID=UPI0035CB54FD